MPLLRANEAIPEQNFIPRELQREEAWGEIWHAVWGEDRESVLLVAYTTPEGDAMFEEALPALKRWKDVAGGACPHLLKIIEISESAIPFVVVKDPGGPSLRNAVESKPERLPLKELGMMGVHVSTGIVEAEAYELGPVGISPDTIFRSRDERDYPWRLLPVGPGSQAQFKLLSGGRYFPPECATARKPSTVHADCYSVAWLWVEAHRRDFAGPWSEPRSAVPYRALGFSLESCLTPKDGIYAEPSRVMLGFDRWANKQIKDDVRELEEAALVRKRGRLLHSLIVNKGRIAGGFAALLAFAACAAGGYYLIMLALAEPRLKKNEAQAVQADTAELYLAALEKGSEEEAGALVLPSAKEQSAAAVKLFATMKEAGAEVDPKDLQTTRIGTRRLTQAELTDSDGEAAGLLQLTLDLSGDHNWQVSSVYLRRAKGSNAD